MKRPLFPAFLALSALLCASAAFAAPAQVIVIRHAEKNSFDNQLSPKGFRRADALVKFFRSEPAVKRYGLPAAIYAAAPKNEDSSVRSIQTVTPLAVSLKLEINSDFTRGQVRKLTRDIMENPDYDGRMVLVCWQHGNIAEFAEELAAYNGSPQSALAGMPAAWPDEAFDRAWILDLSRGKVISFLDIPQRLLPGDSVN